MRIVRENVGLAYEAAGQGDPALLLVHGWGLDRSGMRALFEHARQHRQVVSVDLRGFGESDAPFQPYTIAGYSNDLAFLASTLGLERPVVVGHSMGALIALDYAARHAQQVSAAVLLEGMVLAPADVLDGLRPLLQGIRSAYYRDVVERAMRFLTGPHFDPAQRAELIRLAGSCAQHVLVAALEGMLEFDSAAAARDVKCPLLYIGTNVTYADLARLQQLCPQLVTGQLVGCGHYFPLEVPEQLNAMLARFLETSVQGSRRGLVG